MYLIFHGNVRLAVLDCTHYQVALLAQYMGARLPIYQVYANQGVAPDGPSMPSFFVSIFFGRN
jgi:hypothetical protein